MTLRDLMARNARQIVGGPWNGEAVTYHFADGTPDRALQAIVSRTPLEPLDDPNESATVQTVVVFLARHPEQGIENFDEGDAITLPVRTGLPPVRCRIVEEISSDDLGWLLRVMA